MAPVVSVPLAFVDSSIGAAVEHFSRDRIVHVTDRKSAGQLIAHRTPGETDGINEAAVVTDMLGDTCGLPVVQHPDRDIAVPEIEPAHMAVAPDLRGMG